MLITSNARTRICSHCRRCTTPDVTLRQPAGGQRLVPAISRHRLTQRRPGPLLALGLRNRRLAPTRQRRCLSAAPPPHRRLFLGEECHRRRRPAAPHTASRAMLLLMLRSDGVVVVARAPAAA